MGPGRGPRPQGAPVWGDKAPSFWRFLSDEGLSADLRDDVFNLSDILMGGCVRWLHFSMEAEMIDQLIDSLI